MRSCPRTGAATLKWRKHRSLLGISNIIRNTLGDFMWKYRWNIRFKNMAFPNQPNGCIFDDPCLSKFGALHGSCPHSGRQFVGLLCVPYGTSEQNITAPEAVFESASALFSIADAGEFGSRGFILSVKKMPLGTPESPPIVSGVSDMHPSDCQTWKRH